MKLTKTLCKRSRLWVTSTFVLVLPLFASALAGQSTGIKIPIGNPVNKAVNEGTGVFVPLYIMGDTMLEDSAKDFLLRGKNWELVRDEWLRSISAFRNNSECSCGSMGLNNANEMGGIQFSLLVPLEAFETVMHTFIDQSGGFRVDTQAGEGLGDLISMMKDSIRLRLEARCDITLHIELTSGGCLINSRIDSSELDIDPKELDDYIKSNKDPAREPKSFKRAAKPITAGFIEFLLKQRQLLNTLRVLPMPGWDPQGERYVLRLMTAVPQHVLTGTVIINGVPYDVNSTMAALTKMLEAENLSGIWQALIETESIGPGKLEDVKSCIRSVKTKSLLEKFWQDIRKKAVAKQYDLAMSASAKQTFADHANDIEYGAERISLDELKTRLTTSLNANKSFVILGLYEIEDNTRLLRAVNEDITSADDLQKAVEGPVKSQYEVDYAYRVDKTWHFCTVRFSAGGAM